jgi:hypothetical protein
MPATDSAISSSSASTSTTNHQSVDKLSVDQTSVDPTKQKDDSWFGRMFASNLEKEKGTNQNSSDTFDKSNYARKHTVGEFKALHQDFNAPKEGSPVRGSQKRSTRPIR